MVNKKLNKKMNKNPGLNKKINIKPDKGISSQLNEKEDYKSDRKISNQLNEREDNKLNSKDYLIIKKITDFIPAMIAIIFAYAFFFAVGIGCPIKFLTGISCMGCGMTRAWIALLKLNFLKAFSYHPLVLLPVPCVFLFTFKSKMSKKDYKILLNMIICAFIVAYIFRMMDLSDSVVVFEPKNGFVYRMLKKLF